MCLESIHDKMLELRKDFGLHDGTYMMVMLSICTKDMSRYASMYPDVWFINCTAVEFIQINLMNQKKS